MLYNYIIQIQSTFIDLKCFAARFVTLKQAKQNVVVQDVRLSRLFHWTIITVIAFDWQSKNAFHALNIYECLDYSKVRVLAVKILFKNMYKYKCI